MIGKYQKFDKSSDDFSELKLYNIKLRAVQMTGFSISFTEKSSLHYPNDCTNVYVHLKLVYMCFWLIQQILNLELLMRIMVLNMLTQKGLIIKLRKFQSYLKKNNPKLIAAEWR